MTLKRAPAKLILLVLLGFSGPAASQPAAPPGDDADEGPPPSEQERLRSGIELYESANFNDCSLTFSELLSPASPKAILDPERKRLARFYYIACLLGQGDTERADAQIRLAVEASPLIPPDPDVFPQPVIARYRDVKDKMIEEAKEKVGDIVGAEKETEAREKALRTQIAVLRDFAGDETVVRKNSRWMAAVPFGVGQFQNQDKALGWVFLTSETVLLTLWLTAVTSELALTAKADDPNKDQRVLSNRLDTWRRVNTITGWSLLGVAGLGIFEAQLAYEPKFESKRKRILPDEFLVDPAPPRKVGRRWAPIATPLPGGAELGIVGRF